VCNTDLFIWSTSFQQKQWSTQFYFKYDLSLDIGKGESVSNSLILFFTLKVAISEGGCNFQEALRNTFQNRLQTEDHVRISECKHQFPPSPLKKTIQLYCLVGFKMRPLCVQFSTPCCCFDCVVFSHLQVQLKGLWAKLWKTFPFVLKMLETQDFIGSVFKEHKSFCRMAWRWDKTLLRALLALQSALVIDQKS
jgi:hypothetical protein